MQNSEVTPKWGYVRVAHNSLSDDENNGRSSGVRIAAKVEHRLTLGFVNSCAGVRLKSWRNMCARLFEGDG